ncbi:MAG: hypothetical protein ACREJD_05585 [Phycisphaerales bacterium]
MALICAVTRNAQLSRATCNLEVFGRIFDLGRGSGFACTFGCGFGGEALEEAGGLEHGFVGAVEIGIEGGVDGWFLGSRFVGVYDVGGGLRGGGEREAADESRAVHGCGLHEIEAGGDIGTCHPERKGLERDAHCGAEVFE